MSGRPRPRAATNGLDDHRKSEFYDALDPLAETAVRRLRSGLLEEHHRTVLACLLIALQRSVQADDLMPTAVNAAFLGAVHTLGAGPMDGS